MTSVASIRYEGSSVTLNSTLDSDGDQFMFSDLEGWDMMDLDVETIPHYKVGSAFGKGVYPKRELNLKGAAIGNPAVSGSVFRAMRKVENWFTDFTFAERWLYVDLASPGLSMQFKTIPGGKLHFDETEGSVAKFEVPFTCLDPRKYLQSLQQVQINNETKTLTNGGNFHTYLMAYLLADATNPSITISNSYETKTFTLNGAMPAGVVVDFLNRQTVHPTLGIRDLAVIPRPWPALFPGGNAVSTVGNWRCDYRDAYR